MLNNKKIFYTITAALFAFSSMAGVAWSGHLEPFKTMPSPSSNPGTEEKVELGKLLFFDRRLSGDGTMSCATCHITDLGFGDGQAIGLNYPTTKNWRNTQTLINVAYQKFLFHDGRVGIYEKRLKMKATPDFEMNQNLDFLEEEIRSVPEYRELFSRVFGSDDTSRERIAMAIAAFERTLISRNAPLDRYLDGAKDALSPGALKGLEVFTGKGKCTDCHYGVALIDNRFHALNVPEHPDFQEDPRVAATRRFVAKVNHYEEFRTLEEDPGRYLITKNDADWRAFRTPTIRDISRTGPYMHNGIFETLEEVIDFFDRGEAPALTPLNLTDQEKSDLRVFMEEALTGEEIVVKTPRVP